MNTLTVTDANGCTVSVSATLSEPTALTLSITTTDVSCNGGNNGSITLGVSGGTPPYAFSWDNGASTQNLFNLTAGTYNATVSDGNNCLALASVTITEPGALNGTFVITDVNCKGGASGAVDLSVTGGTPPFSYLWSNGVSTEDLNNVEAATYMVTISDANGCVFNGSATVNEPTQLSTTSIVTTVSECHGGNDGAIDLTVAGGTPPYTYAWSNGSTMQDLTGLTVGTYHISVVDANNCLHVDSVEVTLDAGMSIASSSSNVDCNGGSTGSINITVTGGLPPYTYSWTDGPTTEDRSGLSAGTYNLLVLDSRNCPEVIQVTITEPTALSIAMSQTPTTCAGGADGTATAVVTGGTPPYDYLWETGSTLSELTGITAGRYTVDITDANGCVASDSVNVNSATAVNGTTIRTDVSCNGGADGGLDLTPFGGTPPYTFSWSNGDSGEDISNQPAGNYTVTITDDNGCTGTVSSFVSEPALLVATVNSVDISCNGNNDGEVSVTATGGTPGYSYLWSTGSTMQNVTGLGGGTYTVTVTDQNGCESIKSGFVAEPSVIVVNSTVTDVDCNGGSDGAIDLSVSGGSSPYFYNWSNGEATEDISGLSAGTYSITITDVSGCVMTTSFTVSEPTAISLSISGTNVSCNGGTDGTASVTASGGTPPYTYLWSGGQTSASISGIAAGTHDVSVTDANGCSMSASTVVSEPAAISITVTVTDESCMASGDGAISLSISGGTAPYSYSWSNGSTSQTISGLSAGNYVVTITDANGCTAMANGTVSAPTVLSVSSVVSDVTCNSNSDGDIDVTVSGGTPPYSFLWNTGASTEDLSGLVAGTYTVTVTDANGCTAEETNVMNELIAVTSTHVATGVTCNGLTNGAIDLTVSGGFGGYTYAWSNGETTEDLSNLAGGVYMVTVTDGSGCQIVESITVAEPGAIALFFLVTDVSVFGGNDGAIDLVVNGGTPPFTYLWSNGANTQDLNNLPAGQYTVAVTDANGCQQFGGITVGQPVPNCSAPTNLVTVNIGPTSAVLTWDTVGNAHHYRIRGRKVGTAGWVIINIPTADIDYKQVFGLGNNSTFEWQIRSYCDAAETIASEWSVLDSFTTECPMVTNTWTTSITATSAQFNWDPVAPSAGYEIQGRRVGGAWIPIFIGPGLTQKTVSILTPGTTYDWRIRNYCANPSPKSEWSVINTFTTPTAQSLEKSGDDPFGSHENRKVSIQVYPNPNEGQFRFEYVGGTADRLQVRIFNIKGETVISDLMENDGPIDQLYNISHFGKGLYTIQVIDGDVVTHDRFVVQ